MDWTDEAAQALEKLTGDPMAEAVEGTAEIVAVSEPAARGRYQQARVELLVQAPGLDPTPLQTEVVFDRRSWPTVGTRLPARIPLRHPALTQVDWDALPV